MFLKTFKKVSGIDIPYQIVEEDRRCCGNILRRISQRMSELKAKNIDEMIEDGWNWQQNNKN